MVQKMWKDERGNQEEGGCPQRNLGGSRQNLKERVERRERLALRNKLKSEKDFQRYEGQTNE